MKPGKAPKPTNIKLLQGNPGKRPLNKNEPEPNKLTRAPLPPRVLGQEGRKLWTRTAKELMGLGLLTRLDLTVLTSYCDAFDVWMIARKAFNEEGQKPVVFTPAGVKANPLLLVMRQSRDDMRKLANEFGLTPASRSRLEVTTPESDEARGRLFSMLTGKEMP